MLPSGWLVPAEADDDPSPRVPRVQAVPGPLHLHQDHLLHGPEHHLRHAHRGGVLSRQDTLRQARAGADLRDQRRQLGAGDDLRGLRGPGGRHQAPGGGQQAGDGNAVQGHHMQDCVYQSVIIILYLSAFIR